MSSTDGSMVFLLVCRGQLASLKPLLHIPKYLMGITLIGKVWHRFERSSLPLHDTFPIMLTGLRILAMLGGCEFMWVWLWGYFRSLAVVSKATSVVSCCGALVQGAGVSV